MHQKPSHRLNSLLAAVALFAPYAAAQTPYLVKDFSTQYSQRFGLAPQRMVADGDTRVFFFGSDRANSLELWTTDGTAGGTTFVRDIRAGGVSIPDDGPRYQTVLINHILYFAANDGVAGEELWRSDGTVNGTYRVVDLFPGSRGGGPQWLCDVEGELFFGASRASAEYGLWRSNGTAAGTQLIKQHTDSVSYTVSCNGLLFYVAADTLTGEELWRSDGTTSGTFLLKDIWPTWRASEPYPIVPFGAVVLFGAKDPDLGRELWRSDGTTAGTYVVKNLAGSSDSFLDQLVVAGDRAFFVADDGTGQELWVTDGTETGTMNVFQSQPGSSHHHIRGLQAFGDLVLFLSDTELWRSDGTAGGTWKVSDASWNEGLQVNTGRRRITSEGLVYFVSTYGGIGLELWRTDGTTSGTFLLKDAWPGAEGSDPRFGAALNGKLLYQAGTPEDGAELWHSDGTPEGTAQLASLSEFNGDGAVKNMVDVGGTLYLTAWDDASSKTGVFRTQGTAATTELITTVTTGSFDAQISTLTPVNGNVFFYARDDAFQTGLYFTDGTPAGTSKLLTIAPTGGLPGVNDDLLYFGNNGLGLGYELWISDGTAAGTSLVRDIRPGSAGSVPQVFTPFADDMLFFADDGEHGMELWITDATEAGTVLVKDINAGAAGSLQVSPTITPNMVELDGALLLAAADSTFGNELWRTDGTEAGTWMVLDVRAGSGSSNPAMFTRVDDVVYFFCYTQGPGYDLWTTDGTTAGTVKVVTLGADLTGIRQFASPVGWQGILYFLLYNETIGTELWRSDGTDAGTYAVTQIWPEVYPRPFVASFSTAGPLLFPGYSPYAGVELFRSDGSALGTLPVEIMPGPRGSAATAPTASGGLVYFPANDCAIGQELWAVSAEELVFPTCLADLNGDGLVDFSDYLEFLNFYDSQDPRVDFNQDGLVDFSDYLEFLNLYDAGC
ncbi:MAG: hypothetical protein IT436_15855 [Phycisphaerales bacterium]|nr:hypothetical protein [Phycisphaerales bacterium]